MRIELVMNPTHLKLERPVNLQLTNLTKVIDRSTARNAATSKNIDHIKDYCRALYKWTPSSKGLGGCMELE